MIYIYIKLNEFFVKIYVVCHYACKLPWRIVMYTCVYMYIYASNPRDIVIGINYQVTL